MDPISICTELKEAGASREEVCSAAKANGLDRLETIRLLRSLFDLTLAEAKAVMDGPVRPQLPRIESHEQLLQVLSAELGYCDCASEEALSVLVRFLRGARKRSDSSGDPAGFASASRELEACLPPEATGLGDWFVYGLEQRGLVSHNFRVTDAWITDKGRWLLEAIERLDVDARG
jgi:hypothetical protein